MPTPAYSSAAFHPLTPGNKHLGRRRLMPIIVAALGLGAVGCYEPVFREGLMCSPAGECPAGQSCVGGLCRSSKPGSGGSIDLPQCTPVLTRQASLSLAADVPTGAAGDTLMQFGAQIAINDTLLVVSAPGYNADGIVDKGVMKRYRKSTNGVWLPDLLPFTIASLLPETRFGDGASQLSGTTMLASAAISATARELYAFDVSTEAITITQVLDVDPADAGLALGSSMAINGDLLAVAAPDTNKIYFYEQRGGVWASAGAIVVPGKPATGLAVDGDTLAVGIPSDAESGPGAGAVLVYRRVGAMWTQEATLRADGLTSVDDTFLGTEVLLAGDVLIAAAPQDDGRGTDAGRVFVYHRSGTSWGLVQEIEPPSAGNNQYFGRAMALIEGALIISNNGLGSILVYGFDGSAFAHALTEGCSARCADEMAAYGNELAVGSPAGGFGNNGQVLLYDVRCQ